MYDRKSGMLLGPGLVVSARREEVDLMRKIGLFEEAAVEECWRETGRAPISTKCVDISKGAGKVPAEGAGWSQGTSSRNEKRSGRISSQPCRR